MRKRINLLQEFSIPLILGVFVGVLVANIGAKNDDGAPAPPANTIYYKLVHTPIHKIATVFSETEHGHDHKEGHDDDSDHKAGHAETKDHDSAHAGEDAHAGDDHGGHGWEHYLTLHFLINEIFMVFFFGIAAKEITESTLPGGALNPLKNAINPLLGTIGGVVGPVGVYFLLNGAMGEAEWNKGWGIPTATDIALAWLVARLIFGKGHPAVSFLLLLAVADDAIGLGIIAFFYPKEDPAWLNTLWIIPGMLIAYGLRRKGVQNWMPYVFLGGAFSWWGLYSAHLHPALALVTIIPFLPGPKRDIAMFTEEADYEAKEKAADEGHGHRHSPLEQFEHSLKFFVDFGLFFFAFANAGVAFTSLSNMTWIIFLSLLAGKTIGITLFSWGGKLVGFPLPEGMQFRHLLVASLIAGIGLTVALFVAGEAFKGDAEMATQGAAKMGALLSGGIAIIAILVARILGIKPVGKTVQPPSTS
jgi:NhaA family Na+:H+ antiporter